MLRIPLFAALLAGATLAGCSRAPDPPPPAASPQEAPKTFLGKQVDKALTEARRELHAGNLRLDQDFNITVNGGRISNGQRGSDPSLPRAEITPQGALLVDGKDVPLDAAQREQVLAYRQSVLQIADAGIALGGRGADLAGAALGGVAGVIFGGKEGEQAFEQRMEAEGKKLEVEARKLCTLLPDMLARQQALAASMPEFQPYARMTQQDVDDCLKDDAGSRDARREEIRAEIRQGIRDGIRETVRVRSGGNEADEAAAATATPAPAN
jgi:hypothetical protein